MNNPYTIFNKKYLQGEFQPEVKYYYDRSDMVRTTLSFSHSHITAEIMYVNKGLICLNIEGKSVRLGPRQFIFIDSGVYHSSLYYETPDVSMMNVEFVVTEEKGSTSPSIAELWNAYAPLREAASKPCDYRVFTDNDNSIYLILKQIINFADEDKPAEELRDMLCTELLLNIAYLWNDNPQATYSNKYVSFTDEYLEKNYEYDVRIADIASELGIHPSYLQMIYKQEKNCTIIYSLQKIRINKAMELLKNKDMSLLDIANAVGISSAQYLQKLFFKHMGISVGRYKKINVE